MAPDLETADPAIAPAAAEVAAAPPVPAPSLRRVGRRGLVIALIVVLVVVAAGGGSAALANAALSSKYSPGQAALDYFAAQQRGDATGMMANATFPHADPRSPFFDKTAVAAMLRTRDNSDLKNVKVLSITGVDANTSWVVVSMTWAGSSRTAKYPVRRDKSQTHLVFYNSWRVEVPSNTINFSLPNQPGLVTVDGIIASSKFAEVISGYHTVTMAAGSFYDPSSKIANAVDAETTVQLDGNVSAAAMSTAAASVKDTLNNHCDAAKYSECPGHTYSAPNDGQTWYLQEPGYPEIDFKTYVFTFTSDPTAGMKVVVGTDAGQLTASGTCATTLTVNGSQTYGFTGTWTATMTWKVSSISQTDVKFDCAAAKA